MRTLETIENRRGCHSGQFRCENGPCIPDHQRCDGKVDCPRDSSDELDCPLAAHTVRPHTYYRKSVASPFLNEKKNKET